MAHGTFLAEKSEIGRVGTHYHLPAYRYIQSYDRHRNRAVVGRCPLLAQISVLHDELDIATGTESTTHEVLKVAKGVEVYEIEGPFFFGVATKFDELMRSMADRPLVRIIRMRKVPFIDSTAIHNLEILITSSQKEKIHVILSGVNPTVHATLKKANIDRLIGDDHICDHITKAVAKANEFVAEMKK